MTSVDYSEMTCFMCKSMIFIDNGIKIHKCFSLFCQSCPDDVKCPACSQVIRDNDFINIKGTKPCHFHATCNLQASIRCSCMNMDLCELDLVKVHRKVPANMKCTPVPIGNEKDEQLCSICKQIYSSYIHKENKDELCIKCYLEHDSKDLYMDKDEHVKANMKKRMDLLLNAVTKSHTLFISRISNFENESDSFNSKFHEFMELLKQKFAQCEQENATSLKKLELTNHETADIVKRLKSNHLLYSLLFLSKNEITSKQALDKLESWIKSLLKKLVVPSVSKFNIAPTNSIRFVKDATNTCFNEALQAIDIFPAHFDMESSTRQEPCSSRQSGAQATCTSKRKPEQDYNEDDASSKKLLIDIVDDDAAINPDDMFLSSDDENEHPIMSFGDAPKPGLYGDAVMRFEDQQIIHVRLTGIRCPLWMFFEKPELIDKREEIIKMLDNISDLIPAFDIKQGDYVIVQDTPAYGSKYKRGRVKGVGDNRGNLWIVKLLDYGRDISVQKEKIFMYPEGFDFTDETCFHGALLGVKPRSNFIFMTMQPYNAVSYIKKYLMPPSEKVMINRRHVTKDGRTWCDIKSKRNDIVLDWAKELIKANLALNYPLGPFITTVDFCYLGHFNGKCRVDCPHVHKCPFDGKDHFLKSCPAFIMETSNAEKEITAQA